MLRNWAEPLKRYEMKKITADLPALLAAATLLFSGAPALAQSGGKTIDGEKLFQLYNSTTTPLGYRRHLERVFDKGRGRIAWSTPTKSGALLPAKTGGTVRRSDGAAVSVPPGALPRDLVVTISSPADGSPAEEAAKQAKRAAAGLTSASDPVQFGPQGAVLSSGATVVLPYSLMTVWRDGLNERGLKIYWWNRAASNWDALNSSVDFLNHAVLAAVSSFTVCQVFGAPRSSTSTASEFLTKKSGGKLVRADNASVLVPPGALPADLVVTISTPAVRGAFEEAVRARRLDAANLAAVSAGAVFGPESAPLSVPVTVVLPYDPKQVQAAGLSEMNLQIHRWNRDKQVWQWLPSTVDPANHVVSSQLSQFSFCQVLGRRPRAPNSR